MTPMSKKLIEIRDEKADAFVLKKQFNQNPYEPSASFLNGAHHGFKEGANFMYEQLAPLIEALERIRYNNYRGINQSAELQTIAGQALKLVNGSGE